MKKINLLLLIGLCLMLAGCKQETPKENHSEITIGFAQAGIESN